MTIIQFLRLTRIWIMLIPLGLAVTGAASNQIVEIANHGKFPVLLNETDTREHAGPDGMIDKLHCVLTKDTKLNLMADVFDFGDEIWSIGDIFLALGQWMSLGCLFAWFTAVLPKLLASA